jgi:DNA-binding PadR family transcriptional regulator
MENTKQLLESLNRGERPGSPTLERLTREGYIDTSDTTNHQTPVGMREYLFVDFTEKGRKLLES